MTTRQHCGRCHTCGGKLWPVLDGEEWCPACGAYRRYRSHGWGHGEDSPCQAAGEHHLCERCGIELPAATNPYYVDAEHEAWLCQGCADAGEV